MPEDLPDEPLALHRSGAEANPSKVDGAIREAWGAVLADPATAAEVARLLGADPASLDRESPPFRAVVHSSGLTGAEMAILFETKLATSAGTAMGTALGGALSAAVVQGARAVWKRYLAPYLQDPERQVIGPAVEAAEPRKPGPGRA